MRPRLLLFRLDELLPVLEQAPVRLRDVADETALHELRVAIRRLRVLLRPYRSRAGVAGWLGGLSALARLTGAPRDDEVLLAELERQGLQAAAEPRRQALVAARVMLAGSTELHQVMAQWPAVQAELVATHGAGKACRGSVGRARRRLLHALAKAQGDLHGVRLRVKLLRYRLEAVSDPPPHRLAGLCELQDMLGQWHDREVWLQRAEDDALLQPCVSGWQHDKRLLEQQLAPLLEGLPRLLR